MLAASIALVISGYILGIVSILYAQRMRHRARLRELDTLGKHNHLPITKA